MMKRARGVINSGISARKARQARAAARANSRSPRHLRDACGGRVALSNCVRNRLARATRRAWCFDSEGRLTLQPASVEIFIGLEINGYLPAEF
jgi:hypothetical protein